MLSGSLYVVSGVGAVGAVASGVVALVSYLNYNTKLAEVGQDTASSAVENDQLQRSAQAFSIAQATGFASLGAAVVVGAAAVITGWSTDWQGDGDVVPQQPSRPGASP